MIEASLELKNRIMRRIYLVWFLRKATQPLAIRFYLFATAFAAALYNISFFNVIKNAFDSSSSFLTIHQYFLNSFLAAHLTDHIIPSAVIITAVLFGWSLFKSIGKKEDFQIVRAN